MYNERQVTVCQVVIQYTDVCVCVYTHTYHVRQIEVREIAI